MQNDFSLSNSLLIVVDHIPDEEYRQIPAMLYWFDRKKRPIFVENISIFFLLGKSFDKEKLEIGSNGIFSISELKGQFCDIAIFLGKRSAYRDLVQLAGHVLAKKLLSKANELAVLQAFSKNSRVLKIFRGRGWLPRILMSSEQQFAFLAFEKILNEDPNYFGLPSGVTSLQAELRIESATKLEFKAEYEELLGETQPINAIIGANGVGKTRLLLALAKAALDSNLKVTSDVPVPGAVDERVRPSDILTFTYESALWTKWRRNGVTVIGLGVGKKEWRQLTPAIQRLALSEDANFKINAYIEIIKKIVDPWELLIPVERLVIDEAVINVRNGAYLPLSVLPNTPKEVVGLLDPMREIIAHSSVLGQYNLSSGQRSLLLMTAQLLLEGERSLVLIDEPENHLHPQYVTLLMRTLRSTLVAMESRAVVITHSPFVVRELDKCAVQILDRDVDSIPCLFQTSLQTFGGDVSKISDYVFGGREIRTGYQDLIQRVLDSSSSENRREVAQRVSPSLGDDGELYLQNILNQDDAN